MIPRVRYEINTIRNLSSENDKFRYVIFIFLYLLVVRKDCNFTEVVLTQCRWIGLSLRSKQQRLKKLVYRKCKVFLLVKMLPQNIFVSNTKTLGFNKTKSQELVRVVDRYCQHVETRWKCLLLALMNTLT